MPSRSRSRLQALLVLVLLAGYAFVQHAGLRRVGFVSDSWAILFQAEPGFLAAVSTPLGYHYVPVFSAFTRVLRLLFGWHEALYAWSNLALLVLVAWLAFLLGRRVLGHPLAASLGAVLLVGSAAHHEVTYWLLVGHQHLLAAIFTLLGLRLALDLADGPPDPRRGLLLAACAAAACFSYEGSLTLLPTAMLWIGLRLHLRERAPVRGRAALARELLARLWPCVLVGLAVLAGRQAFHEQTQSATAFGFDSWRRYLLARGLFSIFSLRGSHDTLARLVSGAGLDTSVNAQFAVWLWLLLAAAVVGLVLFRSRGDGPKLLVLWLAVHLAALSLSVGICHRHHFLPGIPGLLLLAYGLCRAGEAAARRFGEAAVLAAGLPLTAVMWLLIGAQGDLRQELALYERATVAHHSLVGETRAGLARRPGALPTYVNPPVLLAAGGLGVPIFENVPHAIVSLSLDGMPVEFVCTPEPRHGPCLANSRTVSLPELHALAADPGRLVLLFDGAADAFTELTPDSWPWPERYTPATSPYLGWRTGPPPLLEVPAGQVLELPLRRAAAASSWVAVRLLVEPGSDLRLSVAGGGAQVVAPQPGRSPRWSAVLLPGGEAPSDQPVALRVEARSRAILEHAWSFVPPVRYTPEATPFLLWSRGLPRFFVLDEGLELPLHPAACGPAPACEAEVEYLAQPGRDAELEGDGARRSLSVPAGTAPEWRRVRLAVAPGAPRLRARVSGPDLALVRDVRVVAAGAPPFGAKTASVSR